MSKHLLHHATFTGAARKKTRILLNQEEVSGISAAFFSNPGTTTMKAEPWDAATRDLSFPFSSSNGSRDRSATSAGPVRRDDGIKKRPSGSSHRKYTTVPYDGHEWRKYGEKKISGLDFPRCYYRCTYSPCPAKKRVEQVSHDDPPMYLVTYQMEHTCHVSSRGATSAAAAAAAATAAPKAEPQFLPFASQVHESEIGVQKHAVSTSSTITEVSCQETCSSIEQPTLPELGTLESLVMNYRELTSATLAYSSPELPILSGLMELESREMTNYNEPSISSAGDNARPMPDLDQAYFPDLATLGSMDMATNYDALDTAAAGDQQDFLPIQGAPLTFDTNYLDVLSQLTFDDVDSLHPLWPW